MFLDLPWCCRRRPGDQNLDRIRRLMVPGPSSNLLTCDREGRASFFRILLTPNPTSARIALMKSLALPAFAFLLAFAASSQTPATPKHHVVFQLSEPDGAAWTSLPIHVNNVIKALAEDGGSQIEVVFYGPGLTMLTKASKSYEEPLKQLSDKGVKLLACRNAMKMRNVKSEDLFPFAGEVDSGIAEIIRKQEAGWAYIH
jgi:intracellular sulfur oxidation DsrE/DsrF family protein